MKDRFVGMAALSALALSAPAAGAADGGHRISGTILHPPGVAGTKLVACSLPIQTCRTRIEAVVAPDSPDLGRFSLDMPGAGPYLVMALKDVDGNGKSTPGDYLAVLNDGQPVTAPASFQRVRMFPVTGALAAAAAAPDDADDGAPVSRGNGGSVAAGLAGSWHQQSNTTELVIAPTIKFQPSMATGYGTNLGGTFGPGSATNTTIVTEAKPMQVRREMALDIDGGGAFRWRIAKVQPDGKSCVKTIRQKKTGRVETAGNRITFHITGGTDAWSSSCGKSGQGAMRASQESYTFQQSGGTLNIRGSGGVDWTFRKG